VPELLLIQPTQYSADGQTLVKQRRLHLPGLALPLLAATVPPGWRVRLALEVIDPIDYDAKVDLVGIGGMGHALFRGIEIARQFRRRGVKVVFGGMMASLVPELLSQEADAVVVGDGERALPLLLRDLEAGRALRPIYRQPLEDLAGLPVPRYDLLARKRIGNMLPVQAGRGCTHGCSFCSIAAIHGRSYLARPVDEVVRDIRAVRELGYRRFLLIDDNIISDPGHFMALCDAIRPLRMTWASQCSISIARSPELLRAAASSGCRILSFGIETVQQSGLDRLGKPWVKVEDHGQLLRKVAEAGILPSTEMMLGLDGDTAQTFAETEAFVRRERLPIPRFYVMTPIPGTALFDELRRAGRLLHQDFTRYTGYQCVHQPTGMSGDELSSRYHALNKRIYSPGSILRRTLLNPNMWRNPGAYLLAFFVNLRYLQHVRRNDIPLVF
jgi:radical SAM superfamily enzyme YgiQ (UPF0313 family)